VLRKITLRVPDHVRRWARQSAIDEETSLSRLVGRILEDEMRRTDPFWQAFEEWKKLTPIPGFDASRRAKREDLYGRR
jgi:hypothetical protein